MMTGDGNLVEMQATIRYTISDPRVYLFEVDDPHGVVHDAAESVLRELTAGKTFADLLTVGREAFHTRRGTASASAATATARTAWACGWRACRWPTCTRRGRWWRRTIR